jgi:citrate synthase
MTTPRPPELSFPTSLGTSDEHSITLFGHDLANSLIGHLSLGELAFWLLTLRRPTAQETRVFEAVLVALADHGFTPTAIAARLTYLSAPEALQGALASGLLGGGSRYLGVTEDTARFLDEALAHGRPLPHDDLAWDDLARGAITRQRASGKLVPGLGHPIHKQLDPRTPVLIAIARDEGVYGPHLQLFEAIGRVHPDLLGRHRLGRSRTSRRVVQNACTTGQVRRDNRAHCRRDAPASCRIDLLDGRPQCSLR